MLIRVTNKCSGGCSHCLTEATPDGAHMTLETFKRVLAFVAKVASPYLMISGGEPTDHPEVLSFLKAAQGRMVLLFSNGLFLQDAVKRDSILPLVTGVQVTNDSRYYPQFVEGYVHPKVSYETRLRQVASFGRALSNHLACNRLTPYCFNVRSATRHLGDVRLALEYLRQAGKFCTPSINLDGTIVAGEAPSCHPIGHVADSLETITAGLLGMTCARCGLVSNLSSEQKRAVGEPQAQSRYSRP